MYLNQSGVTRNQCGVTWSGITSLRAMKTDYIDCLAKEIAALWQGCGPIDILRDEDPVEMAKILAGMKIRAI